MEIGPFGHRIRLAGDIGHALALLLFDGVVAMRLATHGDLAVLRGPLLPLAIPFLVFAISSLSFVPHRLFGFSTRVRELRRVRLGRASALAQSVTRPKAAWALRPDESLHITRVQVTGLSRTWTVSWLVIFLFVYALGEVVILALLSRTASPPAATHAAHAGAPFFGSMTFLDWLAVALPPALLLDDLGRLVAKAVDERRVRVSADDLGLSVQTALWGRRSIAWSKIRVFVRGTDTPGDWPGGRYEVWGERHLLRFEIDRPGTDQATPELWTTKRGPSYRFEAAGGAGYEAYAASAERLLATIVARGHVRLRTDPVRNALIRRFVRKAPPRGPRLRDALRSPLADPPIQPSAEAIAVAALGTKLVLARRETRDALPGGRYSCLGLAWIPLVFCCVGGTVPVALLTHMPLFSMLAALLAAVALPALFVVALAPALLEIANSTHTVSADDWGLRTTMGGTKTTQLMPWREIKAWAVLPEDRTKYRFAPSYLVISADKVLMWTEPDDAELADEGAAGDRRAAYRERAAQLHALIAAHTGLPLKLLDVGKDPPREGSGGWKPSSLRRMQ